ncbi:uncharacterized protein NPIL_650191 [Nephila pilipes]|uniref:Uncharacterized protein n=1 Tax=Nephila pilipes TaxID=299642 RepID=A0A8X6TTD8_NEPPI|nr:uncharacterized protein NPIL_650191 [Nephila pilipes]
MYERHDAKGPSQKFFDQILVFQQQKVHVYLHSCLIIISYPIDLLTIMFISLLSFETFSSLSEGVKTYRKSLIREIVSRPDQISVQEYLIAFRRIVDCIDSVEAGFSWNILFLIVSNISSFFLVLSIIAVGIDHFQIMLLASIIGSCIVSLVEFTAVTRSVILLNGEEDSLKKAVIRFSERPILCDEYLTKEKMSWTRLHSFSLLANTIRGTTIELTGGGMFVLNNSFILSVVGVMFTYGVLIFQFGRY